MSIELDGFLAQIRELSDNSYNFGNEILYKMASDCDDLHNAKKLIGSLWLIGRSYSASPERRNYKGEWIPRPANDGRGNFFSEIAKSLSDSECFGELIEAYNSENCTYTFASQENRAINDNDKNLLVKAIKAVISFNSDLSKAIQEFDRVPEDRRNDTKCNNHISFSSKFLHFYFPNAVFIIDSYAHSGGAALFNGNANLTDDGANNPKTRLRYLCTPPKNENEVKDYFLDSVYDNFSKSIVGDIAEIIKRDPNLSHEDGNESVDSDEALKAGDYIDHCVRSYLVCKFLKDKTITPSVQIKGEEDFAPWTRLVDTVFLNIKKPLSKKETEKLKEYEERVCSHSTRVDATENS